MNDTNKEKCPICNNKLKREAIFGFPTKFDCNNCGTFILNERAFKKLPKGQKERALISHFIRRQNDPEKIITPDYIKSILERDLPSPIEQSENLIIYLGDTLESFGDELNIQLFEHQALIGALNNIGFYKILEFLRLEGFIEGGASLKRGGQGDYQISIIGACSLTIGGWDYYKELKKGQSDSTIAFMAMKFGDARLDRIYNDYLKVSVKQAGFDLLRLDEKPKPGLIDNRLKSEIAKSKFIIADLTFGNNGAYWEAGYAEGLGKPVIYTCESKYFAENKTHFDTNHYLTILWDEDNMEDSMKELISTIELAFPS